MKKMIPHHQEYSRLATVESVAEKIIQGGWVMDLMRIVI
jgi:hypothetical protein